MIVNGELRRDGSMHPDSGPTLYASLLHDFYEDLLEQGVPDHMANLVTCMPEGNPGQGNPDRRLAIVVEPDPEMRGLAAALLEESELSVIECTSAEAAMGVLQARSDKVAFVFADEELAGVAGGLELARAVNIEWPHVHVVVTTADAKVAGRSVAGRAVAIPKPWRGLDVLIAAERAIARA